MFRNTVNYKGSVRDFDYRFSYKFANVDYTCVFDGHLSKSMCFFSQAPPRCREEACVLERVFYHMEIRTLNARGMFREKTETASTPEVIEIVLPRSIPDT